MQFLVSGVDRQTGRDTTVAIDATNAVQAESIASLSMFVAEVKPNPIPDEESKPLSAPAVPYARRNLPPSFDWVGGIVFQARVLRALSWICAGFGAMGIFATLLDRLIVFADAAALIPVASLFRALSPADMSGAILFLVGGGLLRLTAHFALGLRELLMKKIEQDR